MGYAGVIIGIILAIIIGAASENALIGFIIFIAFGVGGFVLGRLTTPKGIRPESHKEKFSKVREFISYGWKIGEKPSGVQ
jgi:hypothetical protein